MKGVGFVPLGFERRETGYELNNQVLPSSQLGATGPLSKGGVEIRLSYIVVNYYNHLQIVVPPLLHRQRCLEASFWLDLLLVWIFWTLDRRPSNPRRDLPLVEANRAKRPKADIPPALTNVCFEGKTDMTRTWPMSANDPKRTFAGFIYPGICIAGSAP